MNSVLEKYIVENQDMFYRLVYSYVKNQEDALDIIQESIYKAIKNEKTLHDPMVIKTWFYRILINTSVDFIRKNKKITYLPDSILELNANVEEDNYKDFELYEALGGLPEKYRTVVILRFFEDLKIEEIANVVGENVNSVKTRLYAALKKLRILYSA